jgi:hypothetical protein
MKVILIGIWVVVVALGATWGGAVYWPSRTKAAAVDPALIQHDKTRVLNVPMVKDGAVQGFLAMQFEFTLDASLVKKMHVPVEIYLLDEAFRTVYADPSLDFENLKKYDIGGLTTHLVDATNARLGAPVVKDVLIADFSYVPKGKAAAH